jgi:uncharacterized protein YecE (DUF72 family)
MDVQLRLFTDPAAAPGAVAVGTVPPTDRVASLAARLPRSVRLGTSSWSFPGWAGLVYDRLATEDMLAREGLAAYAGHPLFRTVGLDRTWYRPLTADQFRAYATVVPDDFRFLVKADRALTSPLDPDSSTMRSRNPRFLDAAHATEEVVRPMLDGLGEKAGLLLFQFPPMAPSLVGGKSAFLQALHKFLTSLPKGPVYAVELRTPAFLTDGYADVLEETKVTHCYNVHPAMSPLKRQFAVVPPYFQRALVVRWMLHSGMEYEAAKERYRPFDRLVDEDPVARGQIATTVLDVTVAERPAFVIANNKAEGSAPLSLTLLAERICEWKPPQPR